MKKYIIKKIKKLARSYLDIINELNSKILDRFYSLPFIEKPLPQKVFGDKPQMNRDFYLKLHKNAISKNYKNVDLFEKNLNYKINRDWFNDLCLYTQTCIKIVI